MSVEMKGFLELTDEIQKMADLYVDKGGDKLGQIIKRGAEPILEQAKKNCPVKSGALKKSLKIVMKKKGGRYKARIGAQKGSPVDYATFVEYGHKGVHGPAAPHPFLAPAFDAMKLEALDIIRGSISYQINHL